MAASFPARWIHGSADCATNTDPPIQVHRFDDDTFILRQNKCIHYEAPFLYLLFGAERALLWDTGVTPSPAVCPTQRTVEELIEQRLDGRPRSSLQLVVAHSHSHGDHTAGDAQFLGRPHTTVVQPALVAVKAHFGIADWPNQIVVFDLGGRALSVIPVPGHEATAIAVHDPRTGILLTGDTFYPGRLFIEEWTAFQASIARLARFCASVSVTHILGNHIEMTDQPGVEYPVRTTFQPEERALPLTMAHLVELHEAVQRLGAHPVREVHDDFIIDP